MNQRGDTIIEVILAVMVFSIIAVGGMTLMNQGIAIVQRSLEISQVRNQMDAQADALRYMHALYVTDPSSASASAAAWKTMTSTYSVASAQPFDETSDTTGCRLPVSGKPFAINTVTPGSMDDGDPILPFDLASDDAGVPVSRHNPVMAGTVDALLSTTYAQVRSVEGQVVSQGIWVEAVRSASMSATTPGYYDFHIRGCWYSPGQDLPVTLGTIVRLYEPVS